MCRPRSKGLPFSLVLRRFSPGAAARGAFLVLVLAGLGCDQKQPASAAAASDVRGQPIRKAVTVTNTAAAAENVSTNLAEASPRARRFRKPPPLEQRMISFLAGNGGTASFTSEQSAMLSNLPPLTADIPHVEKAGFRKVDFRQLTDFSFKITDDVADSSKNPKAPEAVRDMIPAGVRALSGQKVSIKGFVVPTRMDDGLAVEFLLMRDQSMCCFGGIPNVNEWISVRATGRGARPVMDQPMVVRGTLRVGDFREGGMLMGIYRMEADEIDGP